MIGNFHAVLTSTGYFSNSTGSFVTNRQFSPIIVFIFFFVFYIGPTTNTFRVPTIVK